VCGHNRVVERQGEDRWGYYVLAALKQISNINGIAPREQVNVNHEQKPMHGLVNGREHEVL
jgi:hypothetical protein